ncbi:MAG: malate dehydrogenase [Candidatus Omnitrophota bacterium]
MIKKISIIGAGGVGASVAYNVLSRIAPEELILIDVVEGLAAGVALDLEDTRGILRFSTQIKGSQDYNCIKDSDIVVITAGIARKKGMDRAELIKINADIVKSAASQIKNLAPNSIIIVVTNPLDVITYLVVKETGFNPKKVLGMGSSLDTNRLYNIIHNLTKVPISAIEGFVYGPHSKDMIVDSEKIKIKGKNLNDALGKDKAEEIKQRVQLRGAEIVGYLKNKSACFAPGLSVCAVIEAITKDKNEIMPVSVLLNGEYGLNDVCSGVPCLINRKGVDKIIETELTES